jgi:DNA-binding response OmpR family regulator
MLWGMASTVLVVEDDEGIALPLVHMLEREGYDVVRAVAGVPAVDRVCDGDIDLVILDLGLPDIDGLEVCRRIRAKGMDCAIMILTARGGELDRVGGLDVGADDYMAKPFGVAELLARTRALLRRSGGRPTAGTPEADRSGLCIDLAARRVIVDGEEVPLTSKEFGVLALRARDRGTVVTREQLMDEVWDSNWFGSTKTLDVTVGRLRQKLSDSGSPSRVVTVRGVGFRLVDGGDG